MRKVGQSLAFYGILAVVLFCLAMIFVGCDTAPPAGPPSHPGLRACPLCGHGLEWAGRYWWCDRCRGPVL